MVRRLIMVWDGWLFYIDLLKNHTQTLRRRIRTRTPVFKKFPYPLRLRKSFLKIIPFTLRLRKCFSKKKSVYVTFTRTFPKKKPFTLRLRTRTSVRKRKVYRIRLRIPESELHPVKVVEVEILKYL